MIGWTLLKAELKLWARAGHRPQFWWRDDDARGLSGPLERLIACAASARAPLSLAVIPDGAEVGLALRLNGQPSISVMQHGVDHRNDGLRGRPTQFNAQVPPVAVARRLTRGWARLAIFDNRVPVYVPPWHDLKPNVACALDCVGLTAVSGWAGAQAAGRLDVHLDLLRWRPRPRFTGAGRFLGRLRRALAERRRKGQWDEPIGLLTHHLDHDEAAWRFLDALLAYEPLRRAADWRCAQDLLRVRPPQVQAPPSSHAASVLAG